MPTPPVPLLAPVVKNITPRTVWLAGGTDVTITGTNFIEIAVARAPARSATLTNASS